MKSLINYIVATIVTMLLILCIVFIIKRIVEPKSEYSVGSYMKLENSIGVIDESIINYNDCVNDNGNIELYMEIGNDENREINYELSVLVNYEQVGFSLNDKLSNVNKYGFTINNDVEKFSIDINKNKFNKYNNSLIIIIRQDVDINSYENDLVRDTNTICRRYNFINELIENKDDPIVQEPEDGQTLESNEDHEGVLCNINCVNREENVLIKLHKDETMQLELTVGGSLVSNDYIVWAYANSEQIKINDKKYLNELVDKGMDSNQVINLTTPKQSGTYELEVFCAPAAFGMIDENNILEYEIVSAQRYTIIVE